MTHVYSVPLTKLAEEFDLKPLYKSTDYDRIRITVDDVSRPGLQLAGFFDHFEPMRLQVLGNVETSYLQKLSSEQRAIIFDHLLSYKIPALIIARDLEALPECLEMAQKHNVTVFQSLETTSYIISSLITSLKASLAFCFRTSPDRSGQTACGRPGENLPDWTKRCGENDVIEENCTAITGSNRFEGGLYAAEL